MNRNDLSPPRISDLSFDERLSALYQRAADKRATFERERRSASLPFRVVFTGLFPNAGRPHPRRLSD